MKLLIILICLVFYIQGLQARDIVKLTEKALTLPEWVGPQWQIVSLPFALVLLCCSFEPCLLLNFAKENIFHVSMIPSLPSVSVSAVSTALVIILSSHSFYTYFINLKNQLTRGARLRILSFFTCYISYLYLLN